MPLIRQSLSGHSAWKLHSHDIYLRRAHTLLRMGAIARFFIFDKANYIGGMPASKIKTVRFEHLHITWYVDILLLCQCRSYRRRCQGSIDHWWDDRTTIIWRSQSRSLEWGGGDAVEGGLNIKRVAPIDVGSMSWVEPPVHLTSRETIAT